MYPFNFRQYRVLVMFINHFFNIIKQFCRNSFLMIYSTVLLLNISLHSLFLYFQMKITYDDQFLVTVSEDASIILWKIQDKEGRGVKRDKEVGWAEEILITKSDLEEKNSMMAELKTRVDELKMENGYQLRLKDMNYNEKIKELTEKFIQEMESLKTKNQVMDRL